MKKLDAMQELIKARKFAEIMADKDCLAPLMFSLLENAEIREEQEKYDMAALLLYRVLEMIEQGRLSGFNLYVSDMDYQNIDYAPSVKEEYGKLDRNQALEKRERDYMGIKKVLFKKAGRPYLPDPVSLLDGFILLAALGDRISYDRQGDVVNKLKRIRSMVFLRNNSIFAHGLGPVSREDFLKFKNFVVELLKEYCEIEDVDFEGYLRNITWIDPFKSGFHAG